MTGPEMDATIVRKEIPSSVQGVFRRAWSGTSRSASIRTFCLECQGYDKKAVSECDCFDCPLWSHRPYQVSRSVRPGGQKPQILGSTAE